MISQQLGKGHGPVLTAGAADGYGELAFPLRAVQRDKIVNQAKKLWHQILRLRELHHIIAHRRVHPRLMLELRDIKWIRKAAHIKHQIRTARNPILEPERIDMDLHQLPGIFQKQLGDTLPELTDRELGRINDIIGDLAQRTQDLPLGFNGLVNRAVTAIKERMLAPRLLIPAANGGRIRIDVQDLIRTPEPLEFLKCDKDLAEHITAAHIRHYGHAIGLLPRLKDELGEGGDQLGRHIVHAKEADILQNIDCP